MHGNQKWRLYAKWTLQIYTSQNRPFPFIICPSFERLVPFLRVLSSCSGFLLTVTTLSTIRFPPCLIMLTTCRCPIFTTFWWLTCNRNYSFLFEVEEVYHCSCRSKRRPKPNACSWSCELFTERVIPDWSENTSAIMTSVFKITHKLIILPSLFFANRSETICDSVWSLCTETVSKMSSGHLRTNRVLDEEDI